MPCYARGVESPQVSADLLRSWLAARLFTDLDMQPAIEAQEFAQWFDFSSHAGSIDPEQMDERRGAAGTSFPWTLRNSL